MMMILTCETSRLYTCENYLVFASASFNSCPTYSDTLYRH